MPLTGKSAEELAGLEQALLEGVPRDGGSIGNKRLRDEVLGWDGELYLAVRRRLLDKGDLVIGRGKGGSIRRAPATTDQETAAAAEPAARKRAGDYGDEPSLYDPMLDVIRSRWVQDQSFDQVLVEKTASGGRRPDGIWSRPDVTVAGMTSYTYVPGRHLDIVTFEIKHYTSLNVTAVYEALAHRRSATKSYLLAYVPDERLDGMESPTLSEIGEESARHGIGLIVAGDPTDFDTWDLREEAIRVAADPSRMNLFIRNQLSEGTKDQILRWFRV